MKINELFEANKFGAGAAMSSKLEIGLALAKVPKEVIDALRAIMFNAGVDAYAMTYAHAMTKSFEDYGVDGVKHQLLYLLNNMGKWKGDEARNAKKILKKWSSS